jgi:chemotaxis protein methyltransferase CheR
MAEPSSKKFKHYEISEEEFRYLQRLVYKEAGINLTEAKRCLVQTRIGKLMRKAGIDGFRNLFEKLEHDSSGRYLELVLNAISTNHTFFFREDTHFKFLEQTIVPEWEKDGNRRPFLVWSAGCSSGEEPYTISITLSEYKRLNRGFDFKIFASDLSTNVLQKADAGIYPVEEIEPVKPEIQKRYFKRGKGQFKHLVKVKPIIKDPVSFKKHNLLLPLQGHQQFDVVFLRNVMIYFDRNTKQNIVRSVYKYIRPGGYLITGHSESLGNIDHPYKTVQPTIYKRID